MGYGTYESKFNGTGNTFNVSGPLAQDEDYQAYLNSLKEAFASLVVEAATEHGYNYRDQSEPAPTPASEYFENGRFDTENDALIAALRAKDQYVMSQSEWATQEYDEFNTLMIETVAQAGEDLGMAVQTTGISHLTRSDVDSDFVGIADSRILAIGWRSWETDFVIGVGAKKSHDWQNYLSEPENYKKEMMLETGRNPTDFAAQCHATAENISHYIRLCLQENGLECRYKTSGYTSAPYPVPEATEAIKLTLKNDITAALAAFEVEPNVALATLSSAERLHFIKTVCELDEEDDYRLKTPIFNHDTQSVLWVDPLTQEIFASSSAIEEKIGFDMAACMQGAEQVNALSPIPRNEQTQAWFEYRQNKGNDARYPKYLVASAQEYTAATGQAFAVQFNLLESQIQGALIEGFNLAGGVKPPTSERVKLLIVCTSFLAILKTRTDTTANELRKGLVAVTEVIEMNLSEEQRLERQKTIDRVMTMPDDAVELVTLVQSSAPKVRP